MPRLTMALLTIGTGHVALDGSRDLIKERGRVFERGGEGAVIRLDEREPGSLHGTHTPHVELAGLSDLLENQELWGVVEQG